MRGGAKSAKGAWRLRTSRGGSVCHLTYGRKCQLGNPNVFQALPFNYRCVPLLPCSLMVTSRQWFDWKVYSRSVVQTSHNNRECKTKSKTKSRAYILAHVTNDEIRNIFEDLLGWICFAFLFSFLICNHFRDLISGIARKRAPARFQLLGDLCFPL